MTEQSLLSAMAGAAEAAIARRIKTGARRYASRPMALDALYPSLASAPAKTLIAVAAHLIEREESAPRRWMGWGGEVNLLNAKAALLLGRVRRRAEARSAGRDALRRSLALVADDPT